MAEITDEKKEELQSMVEDFVDELKALNEEERVYVKKLLKELLGKKDVATLAI